MSRSALPRILWGIALPILFAELSEIVQQVTNTIFLARVGITELGAIALADSVWELFLVLPLGLVDGIQILTGRHLGRRRPRAAGAVFNQGLALIVGASIVLAAALILTLPLIVPFVAEDPAIEGAVGSFLRIAGLGLPFTAACFAYSALLVSLGRTRVLIPATILLAVTNAALDYVFIFGTFGAPALGMQGAAVASVGAELVTFAFLTVYLVRLPGARRMKLFRIRGPQPGVLRRLVRLSAPVSGQALTEALRWFAFFVIVAYLGPVALAVASVVYACYAILRIPTEAFSEAACSLTSRLVGRDRPDRIGAVVKNAIRGAAATTILPVLLVLVAPRWVLSIFTPDAQLLDAGISSLRIVAACMAIIIPAEMWYTAVLGTGDTPAAFGIEILLTIVMLAGCLLVVAVPGGPVELVWVVLGVAWAVAFAASWAWMRSGQWRRRVV